MTSAPTTSTPPDPGTTVTGAAPRREPVPWLLAFVCFLVPALPTFVVLPGPLKSNGSPARMITVLFLCLVILGFLATRRSGQPRRMNPGTAIMLMYLLLWMLTYGVGLLNHDSFTTATNRTRALITLLSHVGVALYALNRVRSPRDRNIVLGCVAAGLAFACLVGVLQSVASIDLRLLLQPPGFVLNNEDMELTERLGAVRVTGTSQHAIEFSVLAAVTIPLTLYFARNAGTRLRRVMSAGACAVALLAMPAAISRTGVISLAAALLVYMFVFKARTIAAAVLVGGVAIAGYAALFPGIVNALWSTITGSAADTSISSRTADYATVSAIVRDRPVFGMGLGGQPDLLDNEWLQSVVQGGMVGLAAMALISVGAILGITAALRSATSAQEREQAYMLGAVTVGILASSATFDLFFYQQPTLIFFAVFALLWAPYTVAAPEPCGGRDHRRALKLTAQRFTRLLSSRSHPGSVRGPRQRVINAAST